MPRQSAGLLLYRTTRGVLEVLLGHPGGPFWARKDDGAWSIPKGEYVEGEQPWAAARREFAEETGVLLPDGPHIAFPPLKQPGGKIVAAYAVEGDLDVAAAVSNTFLLEWPRGSGKFTEYPELDRIGWFDVPSARSKILKGQQPLLDWLIQALHERDGRGAGGPGGSRSR